MNNLGIAGAIIKAHVLKEKRPLNVSFFITNRCDLRCSYCTIPDTRGKMPEMNTEQIKGMLDSFQAAGMVKFSCSGGEPLLRPDLGEVMDHARSLGCFTSITTNGRLLSKRAATLKSLHTMLISLDGTPEFQIATKTIETQDVIKNINLVKKNGTNVWLSCVLLEGSPAQIDFLISVCRDLDIQVLLQPFDGSLVERDNFQGKLNQQSLENIFNYMLDKAPEVIANTPDYIDMIREDRWLTPDMCLAGTRACWVNSNGDVFSCLPILLKNGPSPNGLDLGWREAFERLTLDGCAPCRMPCQAELYNTFSLKRRTWKHMLKAVG